MNTDVCHVNKSVCLKCKDQKKTLSCASVFYRHSKNSVQEHRIHEPLLSFDYILILKYAYWVRSIKSITGETWEESNLSQVFQCH